MKISFLVTYYNQQQYVAQSLDSILAIEKPCDWEILVGDDGSSDGTCQAVQAYIDRYPEHIFLYTMPREQGKRYEIVRRASANRMNLLAHMTGDYFVFLDGDDCYYDTGFVAQALALYNQYPQIAAVAFGHHIFTDRDGITQTVTLREGLWQPARYLNASYIHIGACVLKNIITPQRLAYLQAMGYYDDNNILINNLQFGPMYAVDKAVYGYRQTDSSTFHSMNFAEQAVLNTQGYDVDRQLIDGCDRALMSRYGGCLLQMYLLKDLLIKALGQQKYQLYADGCKSIPDSDACTMLHPRQKDPKARAALRKRVILSVLQHPRRGVRTFRECMGHRRRIREQTDEK